MKKLATLRIRQGKSNSLALIPVGLLALLGLYSLVPKPPDATRLLSRRVREIEAQLQEMESRSTQSPGPQMATSPIGSIIAFAGDLENPLTYKAVSESGWRPCDGAQISCTEFGEACEALQQSWGAADAGFARLPDLRGLFLRGVDSAGVADPDREKRTAISPGGSIGPFVGSFQDQSIGIQGLDKVAIAAIRKDGPWLMVRSSAISGPVLGHDHVSIKASVSGETRPKNAAVHWIIRVR